MCRLPLQTSSRSMAACLRMRQPQRWLRWQLRSAMCVTSGPEVHWLRLCLGGNDLWVSRSVRSVGSSVCGVVRSDALMGVPSQQSAGSAHHWHGIEVVVIQLRFVLGNTVSDNQRLKYERIRSQDDLVQCPAHQQAEAMMGRHHFAARSNMPFPRCRSAMVQRATLPAVLCPIF